MGFYLGNFYFDADYAWTYILCIAAFLFALIAQIRVKSVFRRYSRVPDRSGLTAEQAAARVLAYYGVQGVRIQQISGNLTDNYDPRNNVISLSESVYGSNSLAAVGVACHEAGHAAQHAHGYVPIKIRNALLPICNIGSALGIPIAIVGFFLNFTGLVYVGLLLYSFIALFQIVTLPVELNASHRALKVINETGMLQDNERAGSRHVLVAAAMTYVAAAATTIANLLRFIAMFGLRSRND